MDNMTFTREVFSFLTFTAMIMVFNCKADLYPPPTDLSYKWLDNFTVNVSWKKPTGLPDNSEIQFLMESPSYNVCVSWRNVTQSFLTEENRSDHWTFKIWTIGKDCNTSEKGTCAKNTIHTPKPRGELVKDFKCFIGSAKMICSWIPVNQSLNLTLYYRTCGRSERSLKKCDQPYSSGKMNKCDLHINTTWDNICILVVTETVMSTFKPALVVPPPKLNITKDRDYLNLSWAPPNYPPARCWRSEVCYKQCKKEKCQNTSAAEFTMKVPYDESCLHEFRSRFKTVDSCVKVTSSFSEAVTYGTNEPPDRTLTVVVIVIPIILSVCVILSCYCFRRHSAIICPVIPDPSAIFKEMMMNGNKELKTTTGSLYTPVPEPTEPCKISLVTENDVLPQNI